MKTKKHYLILAVVTGILCVSTLGETELPGVPDIDLIGRPNPTLADIGRLYVVIVKRHSQPDDNGLLLKELEQSVRDKLKDAHITVAEDNVDKMKSDFKKVLLRRLKENNVRNLRLRSVYIPELRIDIDALKLTDSQRYVFRIQTSVARAVCLSREYRPLFKADVWKVKPTMQMVSVKSMPAKVTDVVLEQVEAFIVAYIAANPPGTRPPDANDITGKPEKLTKPDAKRAVAQYKYVASKNSKVFHKPECRWVKRIKPANLVGYNSRNEAIEAGKRPCKMCKP